MSELVHVQQPDGSKVCGAACVAMALGLTLDAAIERIGHRRGVRNREIIAALGARAASRKAQLWRGPDALPPECIVRVKGQKRRHHVALVSGGKVHDPAYAKPAPSVAEWLDHVVRRMGWRPVSFFPLKPEAR
jgi:hypothetical protein